MFDLVEKSISGFSQYADNIYLKLMRMKMKHLPESEKGLVEISLFSFIIFFLSFVRFKVLMEE